MSENIKSRGGKATDEAIRCGKLIHYSYFANEREQARITAEMRQTFCANGQKNKCLFLDRDGTINPFNTGFNYKTQEVKLISGVDKLIAKFVANGYKIIIVTNQGGIGRGIYTKEDLYCVNEHIDGLLRQSGGKIDAVYYCPHYLGGMGEYNVKCDCRKPGSLMVEKAIEHFNADKNSSLFLGDNITDRLCAERAGIRFYPFEFRHVVKTQQGFRFIIEKYDDRLIESIFDFAVQGLVKQKG